MNNNILVPGCYIWRDGCLVLGVSHRPSRNFTVSADQLVVCMDGEIVTKLKDGSEFSGKVFAISAGTQIDMSTITHKYTDIAVLYCTATTQTYSILKEQMLHEKNGIFYDFPEEEKLIAQLKDIQKRNATAAEAHEKIYQFLIPKRFENKNLKVFDPRILKVINLIHLTVRQNLPIKKLAEEVHLSESRLVKLFKSQIGIPITKYRLGYRIFFGVIYLATGHSVTESALASGFASTAHFSKCYSAILGIQPSTAFMKSGLLNINIDKEILSLLPKQAISNSEELSKELNNQKKP